MDYRNESNREKPQGHNLQFFPSSKFETFGHLMLSCVGTQNKGQCFCGENPLVLARQRSAEVAEPRAAAGRRGPSQALGPDSRTEQILVTVPATRTPQQQSVFS